MRSQQRESRLMARRWERACHRKYLRAVERIRTERQLRWMAYAKMILDVKPRQLTPKINVEIRMHIGNFKMRPSVPLTDPRLLLPDRRHRTRRPVKYRATYVRRRPSLWWCQGLLLLSVLSQLLTPVAAGPTPNIFVPRQGPAKGPADDAPLPDCAHRPFVCFGFDKLNQEYPVLAASPGGKTAEKCEKCTLPGTICQSEPWVSTAALRPMSLDDCTPNFCKEGQHDDCIKPVDIDGQKVYFPMNVCTREMIAKGECPLDRLSTVAFSPRNMESTNQYVVQCDAGFTIPRVVEEAKAKKGAVKPACVPSLHMAAGYLTIDDSPLKNYKYDVAGPQVEYCAHGGRKEGDRCHPLPLCGPNGKAPHSNFLSLDWHTTEDCDKACVYPSVDGKYDDCVILDIRVDEKTVISYLRLLSGPYAQLMSYDDNLLVTSAKPPVSSKTQAARMKRAGPDGIVRYPRCIDADGLSESHKAIVIKDTLLNCATNPVYLAQNKDPKLRLTLQECASIGDPTGTGEKFCRLHAPPTPPATTNVPAAFSSTLNGGYAWILITVAMCLIQ